MSSFSVLCNKDNEKWKDFLQKLPIIRQDIYYSPEYYELYEKNGEGNAQCFVFEKDGEYAIYPFLVNSVNALGYNLTGDYYDIQGAYGYNGVLCAHHDPQFIKEFHESFSAFCIENNIIAEFTRFHPVIENQQFSLGYFDIFLDRKTVCLDLTLQRQTIWDKEYSGNNRNMIRKAEKLGVTSSISNDPEDYNKFIELYMETMVNVNADQYYFFDAQYFNNIRDGLGNHCTLIVSKVADEFVGGMILFIYGKYAHYHLSARKKEFGKYAVNNHFLDYAIQFAQQQGCEKFHFGGGTSSDDNDPLLKFKSGFSRQNLSFYFGKKIHNTPVYNSLVEQWKEMYPESYIKNNKKLLGYREI